MVLISRVLMGISPKFGELLECQGYFIVLGFLMSIMSMRNYVSKFLAASRKVYMRILYKRILFNRNCSMEADTGWKRVINKIDLM